MLELVQGYNRVPKLGHGSNRKGEPASHRLQVTKKAAIG
jgi:hypothetical protein